MRVRLPVFALVAIGTILIAVIPFPHDARREISIAGVIFFALVAAAFLLPLGTTARLGLADHPDRLHRGHRHHP